MYGNAVEMGSTTPNKGVTNTPRELKPVRGFACPPSISHGVETSSRFRLPPLEPVVSHRVSDAHHQAAMHSISTLAQPFQNLLCAGATSRRSVRSFQLHLRQLSRSYCFSSHLRMTSGSFWSDACNDAQKRPLPKLLDAAYASCGVTVRRARAEVGCNSCR